MGIPNRGFLSLSGVSLAGPELEIEVSVLPENRIENKNGNREVLSSLE